MEIKSFSNFFVFHQKRKFHELISLLRLFCVFEIFTFQFSNFLRKVCYSSVLFLAPDEISFRIRHRNRIVFPNWDAEYCSLSPSQRIKHRNCQTYQNKRTSITKFGNDKLPIMEVSAESCSSNELFTANCKEFPF